MRYQKCLDEWDIIQNNSTVVYLIVLRGIALEIKKEGNVIIGIVSHGFKYK